MVQDILPKKLHNEYSVKEPGGDDYIAYFCNRQIMLVEDGAVFRFPKRKELFLGAKGTGEDAARYQYLFRIDEDRYFLYLGFGCIDDNAENEACRCMLDALETYSKTSGGVDMPQRAAARDMDPGHYCGMRYIKVSELRYLLGHECCFAAYTAYHLFCWYQNSQFCGRCGSRTKPDAAERMMYCESCGNQIYPKIAPAVIVAVTDGDRILLSKYAGRKYTKYALIAGFTEIGETAEETVCREVMEEVGLRVKNIRYYKSQPWGIEGNLLLGYFAELCGDDTIRIDERELSVAEWHDRKDLKDMDDGFSLTREMMRIFYEGKEP